MDDGGSLLMSCTLKCTVGSNPTFSVYALIAQLAEHRFCKAEVGSSILSWSIEPV